MSVCAYARFPFRGNGKLEFAAFCARFGSCYNLPGMLRAVLEGCWIERSACVRLCKFSRLNLWFSANVGFFFDQRFNYLDILFGERYVCHFVKFII